MPVWHCDDPAWKIWYEDLVPRHVGANCTGESEVMLEMPLRTNQIANYPRGKHPDAKPSTSRHAHNWHCNTHVTRLTNTDKLASYSKLSTRHKAHLRTALLTTYRLAIETNG